MKTVKNIKTTTRQKKAVEAMVRQARSGKPVNQKLALLEAGYSLSSANQSTTIMKSEGFQAYMDKFDMDEESLAKMLSDDLKQKPGNRLGELTLAFKLRGLDKQNINVTNSSDESLQLIKAIITKQANESGSVQ